MSGQPIDIPAELEQAIRLRRWGEVVELQRKWSALNGQRIGRREKPLPLPTRVLSLLTAYTKRLAKLPPDEYQARVRGMGQDQICALMEVMRPSELEPFVDALTPEQLGRQPGFDPKAQQGFNETVMRCLLKENAPLKNFAGVLQSWAGPMDQHLVRELGKMLSPDHAKRRAGNPGKHAEVKRINEIQIVEQYFQLVEQGNADPAGDICKQCNLSKSAFYELRRGAAGRIWDVGRQEGITLDELRRRFSKGNGHLEQCFDGMMKSIKKS